MRFLRRARVGLVLLALAAVVTGLAIYRLKAQPARAVTRVRAAVLMGMLAPERRSMEIKAACTADILPAKQAAIFSKVSGYIRRIHVERGDFVRAGQRLVEIDDQELQTQVEQARASLLTGLASLESLRANLEKARAVAANDARPAECMRTLFERGLVSATDWENARTAAESSRANVQAAEAQLRMAQVQIATSESQVRLAQAQVETHRAALQLAQTNLRHTRLTVPFAGYISQRNLDPGAA
jgi:multidrug resistance efflux pump